MHELSVCRSLISQVEAIAQQHQAHTVTRVNVQVGLLSGIEPKLLQMAFPMAIEHTLLANAVLEIEVIPVRVRCLVCEQTSQVAINALSCPACQSEQTKVIAGQEMLLVNVGLQ